MRLRVQTRPSVTTHLLTETLKGQAKWCCVNYHAITPTEGSGETIQAFRGVGCLIDDRWSDYGDHFFGVSFRTPRLVSPNILKNRDLFILRWIDDSRIAEMEHCRFSSCEQTIGNPSSKIFGFGHITLPSTSRHSPSLASFLRGRPSLQPYATTCSLFLAEFDFTQSDKVLYTLIDVILDFPYVIVDPVRRNLLIGKRS